MTRRVSCAQAIALKPRLAQSGFSDCCQSGGSGGTSSAPPAQSAQGGFLPRTSRIGTA